MPRILLDPINLNYVLVGLAALTSAGYFVLVKDKVASTWYMLAFLAAWAVSAMSLAIWAFTHESITTDAVFYTSIVGKATITLGALAGPMLMQAAYRFMGNPFPREANGVLAVSILTVLWVVPSLTANPAIMVATARWMVAGSSFWGAVVLLRKSGVLGGAKPLSREKSGMLAVAGFLIVVCVSEYFTGLDRFSGSSPSLGLLILVQILQFTAVLAFPVVYVQYAPQPTTFQVKLVGFLLLIVLSVFGTLNASQTALDGQRRAFDPAPAPRTISFMPTGSRYEIIPGELSFESEIGADLGLIDDSKVPIELPFGFPFAGDTLWTVVVDANGAIEPVAVAYAHRNFSAGLPTIRERALIAPWYIDLNPGAGGSVHVNSLSDRFVVTWKDIPEWNFFRPHTVQAVLYRSGRIDFNYVDLPFGKFVGASGILTNPGRLEAGTNTAGSGLDLLFNAGPIENPFEAADRRLEFKEYLHGKTMPFVWVLLGTIAFVLLLAPVFYRLSITRPLNRLLVGMRQVNDGRLDSEMPLGVEDEFGHLALNFNQMTKSLRAYSGEMESLVDTRTRELKELLESLKSTQAQLVQQEKMASLGALTAGIAHEIKNPLNFVNNFAEVNAELAAEVRDALSAGDTAAAQEALQDLEANSVQIAKHGQRADSIVKAMMQHARGGASEREEIDVNTFIGEYVDLAWHGMRARDDGFSTEMARDFSEDAGTLNVMPQELGRVILNLLNNSFDALRGQKGGQVTVSTTKTSDGVLIIIADNGPGIPEDIREKIFEPFFTTKATGEGTGLGLSLSYDIITKGHGGTLAVANNEGGGAAFTIGLPLEAPV
ncbi:MAG: signal transduction histidine kinase [Rhodothermales bacterium]|jgi:signal transduction histidine kinase